MFAPNNKTTIMKNYTPHIIIGITSFIGATSVNPNQTFVFTAISFIGLAYIYRNEIKQHLHR